MQLNYKVFGEGFPVVILHGLLGSLDNWQTIAKRLSEQFKVYTVDLRNHGKSPHSNEHSYPLMAEDLKDFFQEHVIKKAHLIGHSMGGKVAMLFTVTYPELVDKLVVVDIAPRVYEAHHNEIFDALFKLDLSQATKRSEADEQLMQSIPDFGVRQFLLKNLTRNESGGFEWKMNLQGLYKHYPNINIPIQANNSVSVKTLVIRGANSNYVLEEDISDFEKLFGSVKLVTIPSAGHWVHAEAPDLFLHEVKAFLS